MAKKKKNNTSDSPKQAVDAVVEANAAEITPILCPICDAEIPSEGADCQSCADTAAAEAHQLEQDAKAKADAEAAEAAKAKAAKTKADAKAKAAAEAAAKTKAATAAKAPAAVKAPSTQIDNTAAIAKMLEEYKAIAGQTIITTATLNVLTAKFVAIINFAISKPEESVLNTLYTFFKEERNGLMDESVVMKGAASLGAGSRIKMEVFYAAFALIIRNSRSTKKVKVNLDLVREKLGEKIVAFLSAKAR